MKIPSKILSHQELIKRLNEKKEFDFESQIMMRSKHMINESYLFFSTKVSIQNIPFKLRFKMSQNGWNYYNLLVNDDKKLDYLYHHLAQKGKTNPKIFRIEEYKIKEGDMSLFMFDKNKDNKTLILYSENKIGVVDDKPGEYNILNTDLSGNKKGLHYVIKKIDTCKYQILVSDIKHFQMVYDHIEEAQQGKNLLRMKVVFE